MEENRKFDDDIRQAAEQPAGATENMTGSAAGADGDRQDASAAGQNGTATPSGEHGTPSAASLHAAAPKRRFPTVADLLVFVGIFFVSSLVSLFVVWLFMLIFSRESLSTSWDGVAVAVQYVLCLVITIAGTLAYRRARGGEGRVFNFSFRKFNPMLVLWGFILIMITAIVIEPLLNLFPERWLGPMYTMGSYGGWSILLLVVLAPIFEEALFRGVIFESVRSKSGAVSAILISAAIFGIVHLIPQQVINAFVIGIILGYVYLKTGSLWPAILIHAMNNALAYIVMQWSDTNNMTVREMITNDTVYKVVYFIALAIFVFVAYKMWQTLHAEAGKEKAEHPEAPHGRPTGEREGK